MSHVRRNRAAIPSKLTGLVAGPGKAIVFLPVSGMVFRSAPVPVGIVVSVFAARLCGVPFMPAGRMRHDMSPNRVSCSSVARLSAQPPTAHISRVMVVCRVGRVCLRRVSVVLSVVLFVVFVVCSRRRRRVSLLLFVAVVVAVTLPALVPPRGPFGSAALLVKGQCKAVKTVGVVRHTALRRGILPHDTPLL